jgi:putative ABC transport system permease protein
MFFEVAMPSTYEDEEGARATLFRTELLSRIQSLPQVTSAAAINVRPLRGINVGMGFAAADKPPPSGEAVPWASWRMITRDYFSTLGVRLLAGRDFTEQDVIANPWRVIISNRIAQQLWPGENAVGRTMILWQGQSGPQAEVIGVVPDMLDWGLERGVSFAVYMPYYGATFSPVQFVVHTTSPPTSLVPRVRSILSEIDPNLPLTNIQSMEEMLGANVASRRFMMLLLVGFAGIALLLALAGIYGVLSYTVARRRSEIGMRIALGASRASVLRLIVGQGMRPVVVGVVLGVAGALALTRLMISLLFEVTPADLPTYVWVVSVLTATAAVSCYLPARSAVRLNVISALREE